MAPPLTAAPAFYGRNHIPNRPAKSPAQTPKPLNTVGFYAPSPTFQPIAVLWGVAGGLAGLWTTPGTGGWFERGGSSV